MKQNYHSNAKTNTHIREILAKSNLSSVELAQKYDVSVPTVNKWKNREELNDRSSVPKTVHYGVTIWESEIIKFVRTSSWLPLDEIWEAMLSFNPDLKRGAIYNVLCREGINTLPQEEKDKAKKFKEYDPGYLHIDVTYLPVIDGKKYYLFVAIDRATRVIYIKIFDAKTSENAETFMNECLDFFPFKITHVLTDNGLEFSNKLIKSKKGNCCSKPSKMDFVCEENGVEHRLTKPFTPKTNGMVERVNGTIKNGTVKINKYNNLHEMNLDLAKFLVFYNLYRRHGSLRRELNVRTPIDAVEKWYQIKPEIFKNKPWVFKDKILLLKTNVINN